METTETINRKKLTKKKKGNYGRPVNTEHSEELSWILINKG